MPNMNRQTEKAANGISESSAAQSLTQKLLSDFSLAIQLTKNTLCPDSWPSLRPQLSAGLIAHRYVTENILNFKASEHRDKFPF